MEQEALGALQNGEKNLEEIIHTFYDRMDQIQKKMNQWATETKNDLETYAVNIQGEWVHILNQYNQNIDSIIKTMSKMFQQLVQSLIENLIKVAVDVVPNVSAIIQSMKQQGLLSFL